MFKRYTKATAKKYIMSFKPYRVTKQTLKESYNNTNLQEVYTEIDKNIKNILVALGNTSVEDKAIRLINSCMMKLLKFMNNELQKTQKR